MFRWLEREGRLASAELYRTFNCGIGMIAIVAAEAADAAVDLLGSHGERAWIAGHIEPGTPGLELD